MTPSPPAPTGRTAAIILAAGLGTRMKSRTPKVLHPLCGRPMLAYVLEAWADVTPELPAAPPVVVYSPPVAAVREAGLGEAVRFALQDEPRGTADAVRAGLADVPDDATEILVLSGDVPLVLGPQLLAILEQRRLDDAAIALASVYAAEPGNLGRVVRSDFGSVERIVEAKDASRRGARVQRGQRRLLRLRRRVAPPPDRVAGAVGRRPASSTSPSSSASPATTAGS